MRNITQTLITAAALMASAACVHDTVVPTAAGPSEAATSIRLSATPDTVPADGTTQSKVLLQSYDASGKPIANMSIKLALAGPGSLSASSVTTASDGRAFAMYTPPMPGGSGTVATVLA